MRDLPIKKLPRVLSAFALSFMLTSILAQTASAAILFQDDTFATVESDAIMIGSNDAGVRSTAIQFGADGASSQNGNILFDISTRKFFIDHPVDITNLGIGNSFRVNDSSSDTSPFLIDEFGNTLIGTTVQTVGDPEKLKIEASAGQTHVVNSGGDINGNLYSTIINRNSGNAATSSFAVGADNTPGLGSPLYTLAMGMTSSGFSNPSYTIAGPDDAFIASFGNNLVLDSAIPGASIKFATGGPLAANERMRIDGSGNVGINTTTPGSQLDVKGDLRLSGSTSGYVGFISPAVSGTTTYTLPSTDGLSNQKLTTNGSGVLSWADPGGYWQRVGTVLSPLTAGDDITTSGDIYTTGTGTMTSEGLFTANGGITANSGDLNLNATGAFNTNISNGGATGNVTIGNPSAAAISMVSGGALTLTGGAASTWGTSTGDITLQPGGPSATGQVNIGGVASATPDLLALDVKSLASGAADPASGTNGTMYYNAFLNSFRCFTNGSWANCDTTGGTATLQSAYNSGPDIITSASTPIHFDLVSGNFNVDGAGAVNLTPTSASQFTSGGALTLTGGALSNWGTSAGDLILYSNAAATGKVRIGANNAPSATPDIFSVDSKNLASGIGDPAGGDNGDMYYNEARDGFRCYEAGGWKDCGATAASATTLQQAYTAGNSISTSGSNIDFTLNTTDQFTASGAGSVNLTPTGASSFTSGGALTLTGGAASTWGTTAGNLTLQSAGAATGNVKIGTGGAGSTTPDLLGVDVKSTAGDPAGYNGAVYYNTTAGFDGFGRFRCYEAGAWKDCDAGAVASFQTAYNNGGTVTTSSGNPIAFTLTSGDFNVSGAGTTTLDTTVNLPGLTASKPVFTDASKNLTSSGTVPINQGGTGQTTQTAAFDALSPLTTKGDILAHNGTSNVRMPVGGVNGQVLSVDSTQANGIKWISAGSGSVTSVDGSGGLTGLTLTGGPITSAGTLTLGGILDLDNGGTNNSLVASNGGVVYSDATKLNILAGNATAGKVLQSGASAAPTWSTPTYPSASGSAGKILRSDGTNNVYSTSTFADTYAASNLLYSNGANTVQGLATANNGVLVTSPTGVPSITSTLDFTSATSFIPPKAASDPGTCTVGQIYYNTTTNTLRLCVATNTWNSSGAAASNFINAYDTTTQGVAVPGTFQDVTFNTNQLLNGWTHTAGTASFTAVVGGTFMAHITGEVSKSGGANTSLSLRAVVNGTEVPGSQSDCAAAASTANTCAANFLATLTVGDIVKIQMTGGTTGAQISGGGFGTVRPSITLLLWRLN